MSSTSTTTFSAARSEADVRLSDFWELTKPRLSLMSVITAILGYFAAGPEVNYFVFASLIAGTTFAAFGAGALNMWWEREEDSRMERTAQRPTASGRISPGAALAWGLALSVLGVGVLGVGVNLTASALTAATVLLYILAYTPLKKITPLATEIGAIPGALPPLVGWIAAGAGFSGLGWILFSFLFAWQIPHFMAICWTCRKDYADAGFKMLSLHDSDGRKVAFKSFIWTLILIGVSFLPVGTSGLGWLFLIGTAVLALVMLFPSVEFLRSRYRDASGRKLFFATIIYLPAYLLLLVVDRFLI